MPDLRGRIFMYFITSAGQPSVNFLSPQNEKLTVISCLSDHPDMGKQGSLNENGDYVPMFQIYFQLAVQHLDFDPGENINKIPTS